MVGGLEGGFWRGGGNSFSIFFLSIFNVTSNPYNFTNIGCRRDILILIEGEVNYIAFRAIVCLHRLGMDTLYMVKTGVTSYIKYAYFMSP